MTSYAKLFLQAPLLAPALMLGKCGPIERGEPAYALAQTCNAIENARGRALLPSRDGATYPMSAGAASDGQGASFFLKPSGLGTFLLFDQDGGLLAVKGLRVARQTEANEDAEWSIRHVTLKGEEPSTEALVLTSSRTGMTLAATDAGLELRWEDPHALLPESVFRFVARPASSCKPFPEAPLDAVQLASPSPSPPEPSGSVYGYADLHTHIAFPRALGGTAMAGGVFDRFGVEHALRDCSYLHGAHGALDLLEGQSTPTSASGHATDGYPTFAYWPSRYTNTHVLAYYRWIQRAYMSGLRLMVTNATGNPTMCQLLAIIHPGQGETDCKSDADLESQTRYVRALQDYVDAQEGGPGKGWFRIVTSAGEARATILQGKLAVVLGSEYGTLFDCHEGADACSPAYVDRKLDELYAMGVRSVFPIHRFDNAFGGTRPAGGTSGAWMHLTSKLSTGNAQSIADLLDPRKELFKPLGGHYWELERCAPGIGGVTGVRSMRKFFDEDFSFLPNLLAKVPVIGPIGVQVLNWTFLDKLAPYPEYTEFSHGEPACNVRPLQDIGRYLVERVADRGMLLEIDHLSEPTLFATLDVLEQRKYPGFVSSHDWIENNPQVRDRIFRLGGMMAPMNDRAGAISQRLLQYAAERQARGQFVGVGIGTDTQGLAGQAAAEPGLPIQYPFTSVDGRVAFSAPRTGERSFDFMTEGLAHYGLLPEWVEQLRLVDARDGTNAVGILMQSAEAYLRTWERAEAAAKGAPAAGQ